MSAFQTHSGDNDFPADIDYRVELLNILNQLADQAAWYTPRSPMDTAPPDKRRELAARAQQKIIKLVVDKTSATGKAR